MVRSLFLFFSIAILNIACAGELHLVGDTMTSASVIAVESIQKVTDGEAAVGFHYISTPVGRSVTDKRMVIRHLFVAVCNSKNLRLSAGQVLMKTSSLVSLLTAGGEEQDMSNQIFSPPQAVDRGFKAAYDAAEVACSHAKY